MALQACLGRAPAGTVSPLLLRVRLRMQTPVATILATARAEDLAGADRDERLAALDAHSLGPHVTAGLAASGAAEAPPPAAPEAPFGLATFDLHEFFYDPPDGELKSIGSWSPARGDANGVRRLRLHSTHNPETSERWRAELAAGRLPETSEDTPE